MLKYFIIVLLSTFTSTAQDLNYLKAQDTLYLVLDDYDSESMNVVREKFEYFDWEASTSLKRSEFSITDSLHRIITIMEFKAGSNTLNIKMVTNRKKFLKQNKGKLIDLDFLKKYVPEQLFFSYLGAIASGVSKKIFFVVDKKSLERKDKMIVLRKAVIVNFGYLKI